MALSHIQTNSHQDGGFGGSINFYVGEGSGPQSAFPVGTFMLMTVQQNYTATNQQAQPIVTPTNWNTIGSYTVGFFAHWIGWKVKDGFFENVIINGTSFVRTDLLISGFQDARFVSADPGVTATPAGTTIDPASRLIDATTHWSLLSAGTPTSTTMTQPATWDPLGVSPLMPTGHYVKQSLSLGTLDPSVVTYGASSTDRFAYHVVLGDYSVKSAEQPGGWFRWRSSLRNAKRGVGTSMAGVQGDSFSEGYYCYEGSPNPRIKSRIKDHYITQTANKLAVWAGMTDEHAGYYTPGMMGPGQGNELGPWIEDPSPWTGTSTGQANKTRGLGDRARLITQTGGYLEITPPTWATHAIYQMCSQNAPNNMGVEIRSNNSVVATISLPNTQADVQTTVALNGSGNPLRVTQTDGGGGSGQTLVYGVMFQDRSNPNRVVSIAEGGHGGWGTVEYTNPSAFGAPLPSMDVGYSWAKCFALLGIDLLILVIGLNDMFHAYTKAEFKIGLESIINHVDAACGYQPDLLIVNEWYVNEAYALGGSPQDYPQPADWQQFADAMVEIDTAQGARSKYLDLRTVVPDQYGPSTYTSSDGIHPNYTGHSTVATAIYNKCLSPDPFATIQPAQMML